MNSSAGFFLQIHNDLFVESGFRRLHGATYRVRSPMNQKKPVINRLRIDKIYCPLFN